MDDLVAPGSARPPSRTWRWLAAGLLVATALSRSHPEERADAAAGEVRLRGIQAEIRRLRVELDMLQSREKSLLNELDRLSAELRLDDTLLREADLRLEQIAGAVSQRESSIERLERAQEERRQYLSFRLREMYKRGVEGEMRGWLGGGDASAYSDGLRYAALLSERDATLLRAYRQDAARLTREKDALLVESSRLESTRAQAERARSALATSRAQRAQLLQDVRRDRGRYQDAIGELERAAEGLDRLVEQLGRSRTPVAIDVNKFKGLLDWPAEGKVSAGFGQVVHPRFRTVVPHPGVDIEASEGATFRSVFDGKVAFSAWLHGYGLTAIVDHGGGLVTIYAHASVLLAEQGQQVARGEPLGRVGDTGSLRGPYLYFEMRQDGTPVDPKAWLRKRR